MQATAGRRESEATEASLEAERLTGELATAKLELEETKPRLNSPDKAVRAQGSSRQQIVMDTPFMGGGAAQVGSQMGERAVAAGIPMTQPSSQQVDPKTPAVEGTSEGRRYT